MGMMTTLSEMVDTATWLWGLWKGEIEGTNEAMTELEVKLITVMEAAKGTWDILNKVAGFAKKAVMLQIEPGIGGRWIGGKIKEALDFQHGGVVPGAIGQPVMATVHGGETVTPAGGGGITVNIMGNNYFANREAVIEFGKEIADEIKRNIKL